MSSHRPLSVGLYRILSVSAEALSFGRSEPAITETAL
jgi:hypothetical protein